MPKPTGGAAVWWGKKTEKSTLKSTQQIKCGQTHRDKSCHFHCVLPLSTLQRAPEGLRFSYRNLKTNVKNQLQRVQTISWESPRGWDCVYKMSEFWKEDWAPGLSVHCITEFSFRIASHRDPEIWTDADKCLEGPSAPANSWMFGMDCQG